MENTTSNGFEKIENPNEIIKNKRNYSEPLIENGQRIS